MSATPTSLTAALLCNASIIDQAMFVTAVFVTFHLA